jgi:hypothetical protein
MLTPDKAGEILKEMSEKAARFSGADGFPPDRYVK